MTVSVHRGELPAVLEEIRGLAGRLAERGFAVVRTKVEALGRSHLLPETDEEAAREADRYFEYHLKVVLPAGASYEALRAVTSGHGAWLSRNALRTRADGAVERYVTLRLPGLGRASGDARFSALVAAVGTLPVKITRRVREYTVHDTNLALDAGWH